MRVLNIYTFLSLKTIKYNCCIVLGIFKVVPLRNFSPLKGLISDAVTCFAVAMLLLFLLIVDVDVKRFNTKFLSQLVDRL